MCVMKKHNRLDLEVETDHLYTEIRKRLENKGFSVVIVNDIRKVKKLIDSKIPDESLVGLDGSKNIEELDIPLMLREKWNVIIDPFQEDIAPEIREYLMDKLPNSEHYITNIDILTMDGKVIFKNKNDFLKRGHGEKPENTIAFINSDNIVNNLDEAKRNLKSDNLIILEVSPYGLKRGLIDNYGQIEEYHDFMTEEETQNTFTIVLLAEEHAY